MDVIVCSNLLNSHLFYLVSLLTVPLLILLLSSFLASFALLGEIPTSSLLASRLTLAHYNPLNFALFELLGLILADITGHTNAHTRTMNVLKQKIDAFNYHHAILS